MRERELEREQESEREREIRGMLCRCAALSSRCVSLMAFPGQGISLPNNRQLTALSSGRQCQSQQEP